MIRMVALTLLCLAACGEGTPPDWSTQYIPPNRYAEAGDPCDAGLGDNWSACSADLTKVTYCDGLKTQWMIAQRCDAPQKCGIFHGPSVDGGQTEGHLCIDP